MYILYTQRESVSAQSKRKVIYIFFVLWCGSFTPVIIAVGIFLSVAYHYFPSFGIFKSFSMMYCISLPIFGYQSAYREGGGYLSICYLCQVPFSPVLVFVEDFPSLPRIVDLFDVIVHYHALPCTTAGWGSYLTFLFSYYLLVQPFPASFILLSVFYQIMHF